MTFLFRRTLCAAALFAPIIANAQQAPGDLAITQPWTRAAGANGNGAAFLSLRNTGAQADRLISASTPLARRVELHSMVRDGDIMRMRPVDAIALPPGQSVELRPGGLHIMLIGLTEPLQQGTQVPLVLRFERAGEVRVMLHVQAAGARGHMH